MCLKLVVIEKFTDLNLNMRERQRRPEKLLEIKLKRKKNVSGREENRKWRNIMERDIQRKYMNNYKFRLHCLV